MPQAQRLDTDVGNWMPIARHYQVDGGYLVVVVNSLFGATGTDVFYTDERGGAYSMTPIQRFPEGTAHDAALGMLGYDTVIDTIGDQVGDNPADQPPPEVVEQSVIDMLPEPMAEIITQSLAAQENQ